MILIQPYLPLSDSVIIEQLMNKSTNNFRKCQFCPHQEQKKSCCCQNRFSIGSVKSKNASKNKSRPNKKNTNDTSAISYINTTLPITNNPILPHMGSNILAENSILRTENDYLKRQLHSQYYHVSAFMKDDRNNISTLPSSQTQTSRTFHLHDKLYASNRNLQQALIQLDALSKNNKQLHENNTKLQLQKQQLQIKNEELTEQIRRLKTKIKKQLKMIQNLPSQAQMQKIISVGAKIQQENRSLREQIEQMRIQMKKKQSRTIVQIQNLSPEWVAHTSTKINAIQKNISKLQEQNKQNINNQSVYIPTQPTQPTHTYKPIEQESLELKQQLISTIKYLKIHSQSFRFSSSAFDQLMSNSHSSVILLIKNLCQSLMQPLQISYLQIQKDLDRSLRLYENKFQKIVQRIQNMLIKLQNNRLRNQSKSKNYF